MVGALKKLWTAFFVAVLLCVAALVVATLVKIGNPSCVSCGATVGVTLWMIGLGAHQPVLWANGLSFRRRLTISTASFAIGIVTYFGVETLAAAMFASGNVSGALQLGFAANVIGALMAPVAGCLLVYRSSRARRGASRAAAAPQSTERVGRHGIQMNRAPAENSHGGATAFRARPNVALSIVVKAAASVALLFAIAFIPDLLYDAHMIREGTAWAILALAYVPAVFYVWAPSSLRARARGGIGRWFSRNGRLVPFYVAAILVSLAALRYIFSE